MKKSSIIIFIIIILQLGFMSKSAAEENLRFISSDPTGITIELYIPQPDISEVAGEDDIYYKLIIPGFLKTKEVGKPQLPIKRSLIGIPDESAPTIDILEYDQSILSGYNIYPAPKPVLNEDGSRSMNFKFVKDSELYNVDIFFPSMIAEIGFTGRMRDQRVAQIKFFPIQFNPVTRELRFHSRIRVKVNFNTQNNPEVAATRRGQLVKKALPSSKGILESYERLMKGLIINYDQIRYSEKNK